MNGSLQTPSPCDESQRGSHRVSRWLGSLRPAGLGPPTHSLLTLLRGHMLNRKRSEEKPFGGARIVILSSAVVAGRCQDIPAVGATVSEEIRMSLCPEATVRGFIEGDSRHWGDDFRGHAYEPLPRGFGRLVFLLCRHRFSDPGGTTTGGICLRQSSFSLSFHDLIYFRSPFDGQGGAGIFLSGAPGEGFFDLVDLPYTDPVGNEENLEIGPLIINFFSNESFAK
ncbi:hypothetical protein U1Q18_003179 [Sarracenia purpurea var. burkii]